MDIMETFQASQAAEADEVADISLQLLRNKDESELAKLLEAAKTNGFFYLDLRNTDGSPGPLLEISEKIYDLLEDLSNQTGALSGAMKPDRSKKNPKDVFGSIGTFIPFSDDDTFNLRSRIDLARGNNPATVQDFASAAKDAMITLVRSFIWVPNEDTKLPNRLVEGTLNMVDHLWDDPDQLEAERGVPQNLDIDSEATTLLFTEEPGLQIDTHAGKDDGGWKHVPAREGRAVVSLGGGMAMRAVPPDGKATTTRPSFAYTPRDESNKPLTGLRDRLVQSLKD
ncbi:uncharacterized protein K452DRAFT_315587 [Aplosporella prunicola CBS 121167]|uniref:Non-haem dioxygenase N-terminal domain-containing protein n=1 Tax=Aplosporella prunicola CBS 121167 TaxID=1176127 RepID=A0A6A6BMG2_9PEZI|nr:uncharacterized protein K452DRAFT_315587 [Aplosporella prunicola CBS 121167]KAF2145312.1 hypothetical protein K452DRAFT_315587 [Aplosporella prunicola CBS 121167]